MYILIYTYPYIYIYTWTVSKKLYIHKYIYIYVNVLIALIRPWILGPWADPQMAPWAPNGPGPWGAPGTRWGGPLEPWPGAPQGPRPFGAHGALWGSAHGLIGAINTFIEIYIIYVACPVPCPVPCPVFHACPVSVFRVPFSKQLTNYFCLRPCIGGTSNIAST